MVNQFFEMLRQRQARDTLYSTADYWDYKATTYHGEAVSLWPNNNLNHLYDQELTRKIQQLLGDFHGQTILDLGCGMGRLSRWFVHLGALVTAIDFSIEALKIAKNISTDSNLAYRCQSLFELDDKGIFDIAFSSAALTVACRNKHELLDALTRLRESLRPGGRLLVIEPIHTGFLHRVLNMSVRDFLETMNNAGFQIQATASLHFWPVRLALCYVQLPNWVTLPAYRIGQILMKIMGSSGLGDYTAILATARR